MSEAQSSAPADGRSRPGLVTLTHPRSPAAEAFRTLRTNLIFSSLDRPITTLVVTSPAPDEGKSTTLANLAVTMAQAGRRTILVDCDLRRPTQHRLWGVSNGRGLTSMVLEGEASGQPPLVSVGVDNLWLLPSGPLPPNPADLLGSKRMEEIVATLKEQADIVLFDAPPVLAVTDAALLAAKLDGALLVVEAGGTRREHAQRAKDMLENLNIRVVGAVLNNAPLDASLGAYYSSQ
jgi:capsular exopolysaccharide synthesis family protein